MNYEVMIGLEVHVELSTRSKIFCSCSTAFGKEPNTQCCPVCLGMPGTLPVLNRKVVEYAVRVGFATHSQICQPVVFDRKSYFYPDLPKGYQISQRVSPICQNGFLEIGENKRIRLREIHIEEDAGKLIHDSNDAYTRIDFNRCGVPLLEIVTEPDFRTAEEAVEFLENLKTLLQFLGVSDCKMQEGSLRVDLNISLHLPGNTTLGERTEIKNLNSFKAIRNAIEHETKRQSTLLSQGKPITQQTLRWDSGQNVVTVMRSKEDAPDYRYFPEPDIPPFTLTSAWLNSIKNSLPSLPEEKQRYLMETLGLSSYDASMLLRSKAICDFFEVTLSFTKLPKETANWIIGDVFRKVRETKQELDDIALSPANLATLIIMVQKGEVSRTAARQIFDNVFLDNTNVRSYAHRHHLLNISDPFVLKRAAESVIQNNSDAVAEYKKGKEKAFAFLIGQCMKVTRGAADPKIVSDILHKLLKH